jgi:hypothetical protein
MYPELYVELRQSHRPLQPLDPNLDRHLLSSLSTLLLCCLSTTFEATNLEHTQKKSKISGDQMLLPLNPGRTLGDQRAVRHVCRTGRGVRARAGEGTLLRDEQTAHWPAVYARNPLINVPSCHGKPLPRHYLFATVPQRSRPRPPPENSSAGVRCCHGKRGEAPGTAPRTPAAPPAVGGGGGGVEAQGAGAAPAGARQRRGSGRPAAPPHRRLHRPSPGTGRAPQDDFPTHLRSPWQHRPSRGWWCRHSLSGKLATIHSPS